MKSIWIASKNKGTLSNVDTEMPQPKKLGWGMLHIDYLNGC